MDQVQASPKRRRYTGGDPGSTEGSYGTESISLEGVEALVLDEADRMLDMGFVPDIRLIASTLPRSRQTLLFSATLEGAVLKVARELMREPKQISLTRNSRKHELIVQCGHHADSAEHKHNLLTRQLSDEDLVQAVIFTRTKRGADKLAKRLSGQKFKCGALHGDMSQSKRRRTVDDMRRGKFKYLVATDVAARGLDIDGISHVINFDMPMVAEDYIHRIGRTGRAGSKGKAISLVNADDHSKLCQIERLTGQKIQFNVLEGLEPDSNPPRIRRPGKIKAKRTNRPRPNARHTKPGRSRRSISIQ